MDRRGQISIEFVLIIALMVVIVLAIAPYIGSASESNDIATAAREGATNAVTNLSILNNTMTPVIVENIQNVGSGQNLTIQIDISGAISSNQNSTIVNSTLNSIAALGYTRVTSINNTPYSDYIVAHWHNYNVTLV